MQQAAETAPGPWPTAVMGATHHYASVFQVGSQHLARGLAGTGCRVAYLCAPVTPLHLVALNRAAVRERFTLAFSGGRQDRGGAITSLCPFALAAPDNRPVLGSRFLAKHWGKTCLPPLAAMLGSRDFLPAGLLYIDNLSYAFLLDALPHAKSVFRVTDKHTGFPGARPAILETAREIAARADLTVYAASHLKPYVDSLGPRRSALIPNGVDHAAFAARPAAAHPALARIPRPRAVYVGALDAWFDKRLIQEAARRLPQVSFVIAGPARPGDIPGPDNLHVIGPVAHGDLPALLHHCDVGLIPFAVDEHPQLIAAVNPLKLYEYLACGLPVAAMAWPELTSLGSPAALCQTREDFIAAVNAAIRDPGDPAPRQTFAARFDWGNSVRALLDQLRR